jgi:ESAT-6 protein secretion system EspG family protein
MAPRFALPTAQFAVWSRSAHLRLPYPLDITPVPGFGVEPPDAEQPELLALATVLAAPRVSAFAVRAAPDGTSERVLAVAADEDAVLVTMDETTTALAAVRDTELALGVVTALAAADEFSLAPTELPEPDWDELFALTRADPPTQVVERFAEARLPRELAEAMVAAAASPVVVGVLGASAWAGGSERLGPRVTAWYEYPGGAVLTERVPPHGRAGPVIRLGPRTPEAMFRALATAVGDAVTAAASGAEALATNP